MRIRYKFPNLTREEKDFWEAILLEEIDMQQWFAVSSCRILGGELLLILQ
jgi:hypothetical protein